MGEREEAAQTMARWAALEPGSRGPLAEAALLRHETLMLCVGAADVSLYVAFPLAAMLRHISQDRLVALRLADLASALLAKATYECVREEMKPRYECVREQMKHVLTSSQES